MFVTTKERINTAVQQIYLDLGKRVEFFEKEGRTMEAQRIKQRVEYDLEMIKELGYCSGIENYSRYFDGRAEGTRPFCLLDYFPEDFLTIIDESHVTVPQIRAMYGGDLSRKENLVNYGFRMQSALDNRPLRFEEFESLTGQVIYVSATPADYELEKSGGVIVEQLIRPTGIPEPMIEVVPTQNQIDHLLHEIQQRIAAKERVLVTTLTKRMAEELNKYLNRIGIFCQYIHSDVETLERVQIIENLRKGVIDVLIGVNLLREGLDLPEVSLVRHIGRRQRGLPALHPLPYPDSRTRRPACQWQSHHVCRPNHPLHAGNHRRDQLPPGKTVEIQCRAPHHPQTNQKTIDTDLIPGNGKAYIEEEHRHLVADPVTEYMSKADIKKIWESTKAAMQKAAKELDFLEAARLRDEMYMLEEKLK